MVYNFTLGICPKVGVIERLEFELTYFDSAVQWFNHYTPLKIMIIHIPTLYHSIRCFVYFKIRFLFGCMHLYKRGFIDILHVFGHFCHFFFLLFLSLFFIWESTFHVLLRHCTFQEKRQEFFDFSHLIFSLEIGFGCRILTSLDEWFNKTLKH